MVYPSRVLELGGRALTGLQRVEQRVGKAESQKRHSPGGKPTSVARCVHVCGRVTYAAVMQQGDNAN